jgi:hypothetical protein
VYTASNRLRAAAFLSFGAVVGGTAGRGATMGVGDAATGAIVGRKSRTTCFEINKIVVRLFLACAVVRSIVILVHYLTWKATIRLSSALNARKSVEELAKLDLSFWSIKIITVTLELCFSLPRDT